MKKRGNGDYYDVFGVEFRRVTSIIGRLKRWGLDEWQATCAVDHVFSEIVTPLFKGWMSLEQLRETNLERVRKAAMDESRKRRDKSADRGHIVHEAIHSYYKCLQDQNVLDRIASINKEIAPCLEEFLKWDRLYHVKVISTEKFVFSFEHSFAGTLDQDATIILPQELCGENPPRRRYVNDFKTGSPDHNTVMQLGAYVVANEEMVRVRMDGAGIVYIDGETGWPKWKGYTREELDLPIKMFFMLKDFCNLEDKWKKREPESEGESPEPSSPPLNIAEPNQQHLPGGSPDFT